MIKKLKYFVSLGCFILPKVSFCQKDKPQNLPEIVIHSKVQGNLIQGFIIKSDSLRYKHLASLNLPEYLQRESFLNIRSYGTGMVSSISSQGGNPTQFQILWNGIPINHLMLGQTDAAILPFPLVRDAQIMSGQNSLSFGSGAMSGQLFLQTFSTMNDTSNRFLLSHAYNSLKLNQTILKYGLRNTEINFFRLSGQNSFVYSLENIKILAQQPIHQTGINVHHKIILSNHRLVADVLFNQSDRILGNFSRGIFDSSQKLHDMFFLPSVHHYYFHHNTKFENKLYFNYSKLNYYNSLSNTKSLSNFYRGGSIHHFAFMLNKIHFHLKGETHVAEIKTNNYAETKPFHYFNLAQNIGYAFLKKHLVAEAGTRFDYYPISKNFPFTYYAGFFGNVFSNVKYYIKYSTAYRHPTANELYWNPGGNPNLNPETSKGAEAGIEYYINKEGHVFITSHMEYFNRIIENYILWTPGASGFPTPLNIQKVWSRGCLTKSVFQYNSKKFQLSLQSVTSYVLSTILKSGFQNAEDVTGRQLIYTPRYKFNHSLALTYQNFSVCIWHQYTGYRFTTSDNSQWLPPLHLWDISILFLPLIKERKWALETSFMIQNIFNTSYELIRGYPMPGRIFQFQIKINYQTHKNKPL